MTELHLVYLWPNQPIKCYSVVKVSSTEHSSGWLLNCVRRGKAWIRCLCTVSQLLCAHIYTNRSFQSSKNVAVNPQLKTKYPEAIVCNVPVQGWRQGQGEDHGKYEGSGKYMRCAVLHNCLWHECGVLWTFPTFAQLFIMDHQRMLTITCKN